MKFSEKLLKLRKENGMSQEALAEQLNTSRQAISKWENDQGFPETEKLLMIGNIFDVSTDYLLKDIDEASDNEKEHGFYASREMVEGYIISARKKAKMLASGVFTIIAACILPNLFPDYESIADAIMLSIIAIGVALLAVFAFQLFFRTDKYKVLESHPLVFDYNFLKEFKQEYEVATKKYVGAVVLSLVLIFGGIYANLGVGNLVDAILLLIVAISVYIMAYAIYMLIIYNVIVNGDKRARKKSEPEN